MSQPKLRLASLAALVIVLAPGPDSGGRSQPGPAGAPHEISPPTATGPRGAPTFCFAPPVPQKRDLPPFREWAPPLREFRVGPDGARAFAAIGDTSRVLFLLGEFADVPFDTAGIPTDGLGEVDADTLLVAYFRKQLDYIREYYHDVSYGRFAFEPVIHETVIKLPYPMAYYGDDDLFGERGTKLIWDAVKGADDAVEFQDYDGLAIIHSGVGQESDINNDSKSQIWSAFFPQPLLSFVMSDSLGRDVPGIPTNDIADGDTVWVEASGIIPEKESQDGWDFGLMGVFTHELGHVVAGWPDLYDTTPDDPSQGLGAFCLMAAGTWNANGFIPAEPSAWCRMYAGWLDPVLIDRAPPGGRTVRLTAIQTDDPSPDDTLAVRIPISGDEYFLVNCTQPDPDDDGKFDWSPASSADSTFSFWTDSFAGAEFDFYLPNTIPASPTSLYREAEGLYIWHVDESIVSFGFPYNLVNADPHHLGIDLEEADGLQEMEYAAITILSFGGPDDAFRAGNADAFTPWTEPSTCSSFGAPSGVAITEIGQPGDEMTFRVEFGVFDDDAGTATIADGWPVDLPAAVTGIQPLAADLDGDGVDEIVIVDASGAVSGFRPDGSPLSAPGLSIGGASAGSPLAGDIDGDASLEVVAMARDGGIHVFEMTAGALTARSVTPTDSIGVVEGVLADVDVEDSALELVVPVATLDPDSSAAQGAMWVVHLDTDEIQKFLFSDAPAAGPAVTTLGGVRAIVPGANGGLHAVALGLTPGRARASAAIAGPGVVFGQPTIADPDRDGIPDVIAVGDDGRIHRFRLVETPPVASGAGFDDVPGWPVNIAAPPGSGVSVADINADGYAEILAVGTGGSVHVLNHNGVPVAGWPRVPDVPQDVYYDLSPPHAAPMAADITGDDRLDLIVAFGDGLAVAMNPSAGTAPIRGWPIQAGPASVPVVGDLDGDGRGDLLVVESPVDDAGELLWSRATLWSLGTSYRSRGDEWVMFRRGPDRNAVLGTSEDAVSTAGELLTTVYCQPNPGRADGTHVHYRLAAPVDRVDVRFYDASGLEVRQLEGSVYDRVDNLVHWDGMNASGEPVAPGLYVYRVTASGPGRSQTEVGKLAVIR